MPPRIDASACTRDEPLDSSDGRRLLPASLVRSRRDRDFPYTLLRPSDARGERDPLAEEMTEFSGRLRESLW